MAGVLALLTGVATAETVTYDFETDPGGSAGTAQVVGGQLQLTTNTGNNNGAFHIPAIADSSNGFTATFDLTIIDNTGSPPADGFSFSYGPIPPNTLSTLAEEGWPTITPVISYEVDTWENGSTENGVNIAVDGVDLPGAFTNGNILEDDTTVTGTVTISWSPATGASFQTTGLVTNANFANIPTTFVGDDAYTFAFAARTGGANQEVLIDNLVITTDAADTDGDGLPDDWEILFGLDPNDNGENPNNNGVPGDPDSGPNGDPDNDNLTNLEEFENATAANNPDSDEDTLSDGDEVKGLAGDRPATDPNSKDTDNDGLDDALESNSGVFNGADDPGTDPTKIDTDNDDTPDRREILKGTNPLDSGESFNPSNATRYVQDFDGYPNGTNETNLLDGSDIRSTIADTGVVDDAFLLIKDNVGGTRASFRIPGLTGASAGWTASFDLTMLDSLGSNLPADGFSFAWGAISPFDPAQTDLVAADSHGEAENGWIGIDHISFEVDTWDNTGYRITGGSDGADLTFATQDAAILGDGETVSTSVTVSWDPANGASLGTTEGPIFTNVDTTGFNGSDDFIFAFGGRTGGAHQTVLIDNLIIELIQTTPLEFTDIVYDAGANLVDLTWASTPGQTYAIDFSTTLEEGVDPGDWQELATGIASEGDVTTYLDVSNPNGSVKRFYRVREVAP